MHLKGMHEEWGRGLSGGMHREEVRRGLPATESSADTDYQKAMFQRQAFDFLHSLPCFFQALLHARPESRPAQCNRAEWAPGLGLTLIRGAAGAVPCGQLSCWGWDQLKEQTWAASHQQLKDTSDCCLDRLPWETP